MGEKRKTVRVRIAVAVNHLAAWSAAGSTDSSKKASQDQAVEFLDYDNEDNRVPETVVWVEADVPIPEKDTTVEGTVKP